MPIMHAVHIWAEQHMDEIIAARAEFDAKS